MPTIDVEERTTTTTVHVRLEGIDPIPLRITPGSIVPARATIVYESTLAGDDTIDGDDWEISIGISGPRTEPRPGSANAHVHWRSGTLAEAPDWVAALATLFLPEVTVRWPQ